MNPADPLAALRDIHVPLPPGFWPPAPGLIAAACVVAVAVAVGALLAVRRWHDGGVRREALARIRHLRKQHRTGTPPTEIAMELSTLVRGVALARRPRDEVAGLTGKRWIEWIESTLPGSGGEFGPAARAALLEAPYARRCRFDAERALAACESWVRGG